MGLTTARISRRDPGGITLQTLQGPTLRCPSERLAPAETGRNWRDSWLITGWMSAACSSSPRGSLQHRPYLRGPLQGCDRQLRWHGSWDIAGIWSPRPAAPDETPASLTG